MAHANTVFNQLLDFLPRYDFERFVGQHSADRYTKRLSTWNQLTVLLFAQATNCDSLREIETSLRVQQTKWYHLGITSVARSTLADANGKRNCQIFESLFYELLRRCKHFTPEREFDFDNPLYALDASTIELCLALFPWAKFRQTKGALKLHTLLDVRTQIPEFCVVTDGKQHELNAARKIDFARFSDSIIVMDRGYIDYEWLKTLDTDGVYFVTRLKKSSPYVVLGQHGEPTKTGVVADERVMLIGESALTDYPVDIRLVTFYDAAHDMTYRFLSNNWELSAEQIAAIYKARWEIELFFKWIKQHLKLKTFLGTSKNAVLTQIWVALIYYLLVAYIRSQTRYPHSMYDLTIVLRTAFLESVTLIDLLQLRQTNLHSVRIRGDPQPTLF